MPANHEEMPDISASRDQEQSGFPLCCKFDVQERKGTNKVNKSETHNSRDRRVSLRYSNLLDKIK